MKAKSYQCQSSEELKQWIGEELSDGYVPTLAIVLCSLREEWKAIQLILTEKNISIFGISSIGDFISGEYQEQSISVLLLDIDKAHFSIIVSDAENDTIMQIGQEIARTGQSMSQAPQFIVSTAETSLRADSLVDGIIEVCGTDCEIIGGNAAGPNMSGAFVFSNDKRSDKGIIALILDGDKVKLYGEAISGWKTIGTFKTITDCDVNWVKTLDGQPALDILQKYLGTEIDFANKDDLYDKVGAIFPVRIYEGDAPSYMLPPLFFDPEERSFMLAGPVKKGTKIKFSMPPDFEVIDTVVESAQRKKMDIGESIDAMIIFSCVGRWTCLGPMVEQEIEGLIDTWKAPSIGFFTFGEFGRVKNGRPRFHGTTVSWVVLKEVG